MLEDPIRLLVGLLVLIVVIVLLFKLLHVAL